MKHPPLLQSLFAVMILGVVNVQMRSSQGGEHAVHNFFAAAAAVVGIGVIFTPVVGRKPGGDDPAGKDDDVDLVG